MLIVNMSNVQRLYYHREEDVSNVSHKIYERLIKNNVSNIKMSKEPIKLENLPLLVVTSDITTYQDMGID